MKIFLLPILFIILSFPCYPQLLKGEWEGSFTEKKIEYPIYLEFTLNADRTYKVLSYSKGGFGMHAKGDNIILRNDSVVICTVYYKLLSSDSIYLEEIKAIQPTDISQTCFQKMF